ncbi:MAG: adenylate/guanylate cyclase domain-containing protein [Thermodesulfovibrio sp.]|nr:adenylate/guanylate cyclase domain-containing protein [Thermodesulfovibrio sp.]
MISKKKGLLRNLLLLSSISYILSLFLFLSGSLKNFEFKAYDLLSQQLNPTKKSNNICLIYIDQLSIKELSKQGIMWPWPRQIYSPVIEYLSEAEAVFLDILFTESSSYGIEDDRIFAESIKKSKNVYLPFALSKEEGNIDEQYIKEIAYPSSVYSKIHYNSIIFPIDELKNNAQGLGNVSILPDEDGIYRRIPLFSKVDKFIVPSFVTSYFIKKNLLQVKDDALLIGDTVIPLYEGSLLLKYSKDEYPFCIFSFLELLDASISKSNSNIKKDFFKGKVVFLGLTAAGLFDLKPTPVSSKTPGVFIHATAFENIINKDFLIVAPKFITLSIMLIVSVFISYVFLKQHSLKINMIVFVFSGVLLICTEAILFKLSIYMPFLPSFVCLILSSIISLLYSYAVEGRERNFIKRTFTQYMDKKIVDYLLAHPEFITPGGQKKTVTVFFADIAGFTPIAEKLSPENTALMLHKVLNSLTEIVISNAGVVDKYIGDCIMAFWGAPLKTDSDEVNACKAAIQCIESLEKINEEFSKNGMPSIKIRIGIHTGEAIVGNIGSDRLFNYTVIGDTVNIASRLESTNKIFNTKIIISKETYSKLPDNFIVRELGDIIVKGKTKPITIFELLGERDKIPPEKFSLVNKYNEGYELYKEKKWNEAKEVFQTILKDFPEDGPSMFYLMKIEEILTKNT